MRRLRASALYLCALAGASAQIQIKPVLELDAEASEPSLSPDGKTLAFQWCKPDYTCAIYTRSLAGGAPHLLIDKDSKNGMPTNPRWSPNGKKIAFSRFYSHYDVHLFVGDIDGREERDLGLVSTGASWSLDSRYLVASVCKNDDLSQDQECGPMLFSAETDLRVRRFSAKGSSAEFSPDGKMLAYADGSALMLLRLQQDYRPAGRATRIVRDLHEIGALLWTPDGTHIIYSRSGDPSYRGIAPMAGASPIDIPGLSCDTSLTQLLADGSALAADNNRVEALWRADLRFTPPKLETVPNAECASGVPECSPDGRLRVSFKSPDGIAQVWLSNADGSYERLLVKAIPGFSNPKDDGGLKLVGWSPDGKWIAFTVFPNHGNADTRSYLYVVPWSGGSLRRLARDAYAIHNLVWSRDSKSLYGAQGWPVDGDRGIESLLVRVDLANGRITSLNADGIWPQPSPDSAFLYFFTSPRLRLSRMYSSGSGEERLWDKENLLWFSYAVGSRFLYLFQAPPRDSRGRTHTLIRFDPDSKQPTLLTDVPFQPRSASLSRDERFLYFGQQDDAKRRVVLIQGIF